MASDDPSSGRVTARIEDSVVGRGSGRYRWFVRAVLAALVVLLLVDAIWIITDALGVSLFSPAVVDVLVSLTAAMLTLFLLTGLLQFLVLGRAFERGTETVAQSAAEIEQAAEEVAEAAGEVEQLSDTVAQTDTDERTAGNLKEQADDIKDEMADAEQTADEVKDTLQGQESASDER